ncbi:unnamed protein product, partial [Coccothraustes coccothraustes]
GPGPPARITVSQYHRLFHAAQPDARFRVYFLPPTWKMPARLRLTAPRRAAEPLPLSGGEGRRAAGCDPRGAAAPADARLLHRPMLYARKRRTLGPRHCSAEAFPRGKLYRMGHRRAAPARAGVTLLKFVTHPSPRGAAVVRPSPVSGRGPERSADPVVFLAVWRVSPQTHHPGLGTGGEHVERIHASVAIAWWQKVLCC